MKQSTNQKNRGISLVAILTTLVISSFVMLALVEIFKNTRASYNTVQNLSNLNANGRFSLLRIQEIVSQAGANFNFPEPLPYYDRLYEKYEDTANDNIGIHVTTGASISDEDKIEGRTKVSRLPGWIPIGCYTNIGTLLNGNSRVFDPSFPQAPYNPTQYLSYLGTRAGANDPALQPTVISVAHYDEESYRIFNTNTYDSTFYHNYVPIEQFDKLDFAKCQASCQGSSGRISCGGLYNSNTIGLLYHRVETFIDGDVNKALDLSDNTVKNATTINSQLPSDKLEVRFRGDGVLRNCLQEIVKANALSRNTFTIAVDANDNRSLICYINDDVTKRVTISNNVEAFKVIYGEDIYRKGFPARYVDLDLSKYTVQDRATILDKQNIINVQVNLVLRTSNKASTISSLGEQLTLVESSDYEVPQDIVYTVPAANQFAFHRVFTRTINLPYVKVKRRSCTNPYDYDLPNSPLVDARQWLDVYWPDAFSDDTDTTSFNYLDNSHSSISEKRYLMDRCAQLGFCAYGVEEGYTIGGSGTSRIVGPVDITVNSETRANNYCVYEQESP